MQMLELKFIPMDIEEAVRREAQAVAVQARDSGIVNMSEVARKAGWHPSMLKKLYEDGQGEYGKIVEIRRILAAHGFPYDESRVIAAELNSLATLLHSNAPITEKRNKFRGFVRYYSNAVILRDRIVEEKRKES